MRNKGFIIFLALLVAGLCLYYLSFTFVAIDVKEQATKFASEKIENLSKKQQKHLESLSKKGKNRYLDSLRRQKKEQYLDSVYTEPVYSLFGVDFTYRDVKSKQLNLGLDLQGGMHVVVEIAPDKLLEVLASKPQDPAFQAALKEANNKRHNSEKPFLDLFYEAYRNKAGKGQLWEVFSSPDNRETINSRSSDQEVLDYLRTEVSEAIDRSYEILQVRIDRFGTLQPNIQKLKGEQGRIMVEVPGIENPERVKSLLKGVAKLEFFKVYSLREIQGTLSKINKQLVKIEERRTEEGTTGAAKQDTLDAGGLKKGVKNTSANENDTAGKTTQENKTQEDTGRGGLKQGITDTGVADTGMAEADTAASDTTTESSVFFRLLQANRRLVYRAKDTAKINKALSHPEVQAILPGNLKFVWSGDPIENDQGKFVELYPLKVGRDGKAPLTGKVITDASADLMQDQGQWGVRMDMNATGAQKWKKLTREAAEWSARNKPMVRRIAILLDGKVYSAPAVNEEIPNGRSSITGDFTVEEAKDLASKLKAGKLPAPTRIVEEKVVGPSLGAEAIQQGTISIITGLVLAILFMIVYYHTGGIVADLALLINTFFIFGVLASPKISAALTLPGIAGIVLTIGMAIDANVLIFERIREELRHGKTILNSITHGYNRAFSSIIDANVTTFLTALLLFMFGSGPIRGFAITLMIGIACSFFCAVFITRLIIEWVARKKNANLIKFETVLSKNVLTNINLNLVDKRKKAYVLSGIVIVLGFISILAQGGLNLGVDFKGGRSYIVEFDKSMVASDVNASLNDDFGSKGTEVKTYGSNNTLKITTSYMIDDESEKADSLVKQKLITGLKDYGATNFTIQGSSKVGPSIAEDIKESAQSAVIFSLIVIFLYIMLRFARWQFGLGAIIAIFHDILIVIAFYSIAGWFGLVLKVDQIFIAAMLTIVGYSINDTVVLFDRVREVMDNAPGLSMRDTVNRSINGVLSRTAITSITTLLVVLVLLFFGGEVLRGFSFALLIGILAGTYSSIFIATASVVDLTAKSLKEEHEEERKQANAQTP